MRISEIYASLQGEGLLAGTPSTFVRTSGCNLRCVWCDTPFTSWKPEGREMPVADVLAAISALTPRHVVVTGGEPLLIAEVAELCGDLRHRGFHVTVETAGTVLPASEGPLFDLVSISPKLASSTPPSDTPGGWSARHEAARRCDDVVRALAAAAPHQLKFVVETPADLAEAAAWVEDLGNSIDRDRVFLMPQARTPEELAARRDWLAGECHGLGFRLADRHHITWYGGRRGT
ncbi:MAG: 7-carboxy-7-deazaguanine synthase QueE [Pirellulales bacterium]